MSAYRIFFGLLSVAFFLPLTLGAKGRGEVGGRWDRVNSPVFSLYGERVHPRRT